MIITTTMLWEAIQEQRKMLETLIEIVGTKTIKNQVANLSLNQASIILRKSSETIKSEVERGRLNAYIDRTGKNPKYKFSLNDILEYQSEKQTAKLKIKNFDLENVPDPKQIFRDIQIKMGIIGG